MTDHVLQRVVFPPAEDHGILPLYLRVDAGTAHVSGRRSVTVAAGSVLSLATYFNAFPAAYWAHWTGLTSVGLHVAARGSGVIRIRRSDAGGSASTVSEHEIAHEPLAVELSLDGFDEGGWLWCEIVAAADVTLEDARWSTQEAPRRAPRASVGITTHNKPDYCVRTLSALADDDLRTHLDRVRVVDQGDRAVTDEDGYGEAAAGLGDVLVMLRQDNLGGAGGYARAMLETLERDEASFMLTLDDDVEIEPEAVRRAIVFGAYCRRPTIVGGHMFDLLDRTKLYAWAEVVDEHPFMWRTLDADRMPLDFAAVDLRDEPLVHRRADADYNGWWMCLIPREAMAAAGLALPLFIKWDDAEFSLRAREHGIPTVSLPGVALWHISWVGKDDLVDWQAYFHARNRLVAALLHSGAPRGGSVLTHSRRVDLKHFMSMQYYPVALRHRALRAVLSGPDHLHPDLRTALPAARALAADFDETRPAPDGIPARSRADWPADDSDAPSGLRLRLFMVRTLASLWCHRPRRGARAAAEIALPAAVSRWWRLARYDSALVTTAGTSERRLHVRDRARYRALERESRRLHRQLRRRWDELADAYRAADLASPAAWRRTFGLGDAAAVPPAGRPPGSEHRLG